MVVYFEGVQVQWISNQSCSSIRTGGTHRPWERVCVCVSLQGHRRMLSIILVSLNVQWTQYTTLIPDQVVALNNACSYTVYCFICLWLVFPIRGGADDVTLSPYYKKTTGAQSDLLSQRQHAQLCSTWYSSLETSSLSLNLQHFRLMFPVTCKVRRIRKCWEMRWTAHMFQACTSLWTDRAPPSSQLDIPLLLEEPLPRIPARRTVKCKQTDGSLLRLDSFY